MNIDLVINQLRAYCPILSGNVAGAADFDTGVQAILAMTNPTSGLLTYPVAIVYPLEDEAEPNVPDGLMTGTNQFVTETIGILVEFSATADRRGQGGVSQVEAAKLALWKAVLGWRASLPDANGAYNPVQGLWYAGGQLQTVDRARLFWEFRFAHRRQITDWDGWEYSGYPLTDALVTVRVPATPPTSPQQPSIPIVFDVNLTTDPVPPAPEN